MNCSGVRAGLGMPGGVKDGIEGEGGIERASIKATGELERIEDEGEMDGKTGVVRGGSERARLARDRS